jgi:hypothetical protein
MQHITGPETRVWAKVGAFLPGLKQHRLPTPKGYPVWGDGFPPYKDKHSWTRGYAAPRTLDEAGSELFGSVLIAGFSFALRVYARHRVGNPASDRLDEGASPATYRRLRRREKASLWLEPKRRLTSRSSQRPAAAKLRLVCSFAPTLGRVNEC